MGCLLTGCSQLYRSNGAFNLMYLKCIFHDSICPTTAHFLGGYSVVNINTDGVDDDDDDDLSIYHKEARNSAKGKPVQGTVLQQYNT